MQAIVLAIVWLIIGMGSNAAVAQPAGPPGAPLQGSWSATKAEKEGKAVSDVPGHQLSFSGDRFQIRSAKGEVLYEGGVRVKTGEKRSNINFDHTGGSLKGKTWKGIYALDGDTLTICDNAPDPGKRRPASFEACRAPGYISITFKRTKP